MAYFAKNVSNFAPVEFLKIYKMLSRRGQDLLKSLSVFGFMLVFDKTADFTDF